VSPAGARIAIIPMLSKIERAIHISDVRHLTRGGDDQYQRIYWGDEFCQNLIPGHNDTQRVITYCRLHRQAFTFVSPFVTERGLRQLMQMFVFLKKAAPGCEIVVNDWGVVSLLRERWSGEFCVYE